MRNSLQKKNGITLIALVITIVILIILAGVLINLTLGDNGLFTRTKLAKQKYEYAAAKEIVDVKLVDIQAECMTEGEEYTLNIIADRIGDNNEISTDIIHFYATAKNKSDNSRPSGIKGMLVSANKYPQFKFLIGKEGNVVKVLGVTTEDVPATWPEGALPAGFKTIEKFEEEIGAKTENETTQGGQTGGETQTTDPIVDSAPKIKFAGAETGVEIAEEPESLKDYYTQIVDNSFFTSVETDNWDWQLFYDDKDYIYLIASDYVENTLLPANGNPGFGTGDLVKTNTQNSNYNAAFCSNTNHNDYVLANTDYGQGSLSTAITTNPLTHRYLKWMDLYNTEQTKKQHHSVRATAFMMDTSKWSAFAGNKTDAFAIGGPTIELFAKSYNACHELKFGEYNTVNSINSSQYGYKVGVNKENEEFTWKDYENDGIDTSNQSINGIEDSGGNMWVRKTQDKAQGLWIASPSAYTGRTATIDDSMLNMIHFYVGSPCGCQTEINTIGFRPIVCIPKESI